MTTDSFVSIVSRGPARTAAMLFSFDGRLHVAGIAKTRLLMVPDGPMRACEPRSIEHADKLDAGGRCIAANEMIPFLPTADVLFVSGVGRTSGRKASAQSPLAVRMAVVRPHDLGGRLQGGQPLVDKTRQVRSAVEPLGFGPIATTAPERQRAFPEDLFAAGPNHAPMPALRTGMNFSFFQAAPPDQRIPLLRGDEWIYLEHLHATLALVGSQLPNLRPVGMIKLPSGATKPFTMRMDTLVIDGENAWCEVVARGSFAVSSLEDLRSLSVVLGFEVKRVSVRDFSPPMRRASEIEPSRPAAPAAQPVHAGTMILEPSPPADRRSGTMLIEPPKAGLDGTVVMGPPPARHASTVLIEPDALPAANLPPLPIPLPLPKHLQSAEEEAPVTVMPSSLDRTRMIESAPATRAPFQLAKPRAGAPSDRRPIPGSPWSGAPAQKAPPVIDYDLETLSPDGGSIAGDIASAAENAMAAFRERARREAEAMKERDLEEQRLSGAEPAPPPRTPIAPEPPAPARPAPGSPWRDTISDPPALEPPPQRAPMAPVAPAAPKPKPATPLATSEMKKSMFNRFRRG